jgi:hypothetical protein
MEELTGFIQTLLVAGFKGNTGKLRFFGLDRSVRLRGDR